MATTEFEINLTNLVCTSLFRCKNGDSEVFNIQSIKEIIEEELKNKNLKIINEIWISKYNKFVVYDHDPLYPEDFEHLLYVECETEYYKFIMKLLENTLNKCKALERMYNSSGVQKKGGNIEWKFL